MTSYSAKILTDPKYWKSYLTASRYSDDQIPDLTGKIAIVTGANAGIGYATTVALAGHGARVFMACRSEQRATEAMTRIREEIRTKYPQAKAAELEFLELDLNDMRKCRESAQTFLKKGLPLHILINNSGIMGTPFELSADGIETQFAVNHMGYARHYVFTMALLDRIKESQPSRVVIVSALLCLVTPKGGIDFDTLNDPTVSTPLNRYGRAKLANAIFSKALSRRLANERVYVNALHPGVVRTEMSRHAAGMTGGLFAKVSERVVGFFQLSPDQGALTQLYLATSPEVEEQDVRGKFFIPIANEIEDCDYANDEVMQEKLWAFTEKLVAEKIGV